MIHIENISLSYGDHTLFHDTSFMLQKKERCGLIGRNGSGKSTILRLLTGEESPDEGSIQIAKDYRIGYLNQHISFSKKSVIEEAALGLPFHEREYNLYKAEKILFGLGFDKERLRNDPKNLSGGFQLRLHLAKTLLEEPDCLLLDEPTNYLDILSLRWLRNFLQGWQKECILITHDREFMDSVTTHSASIHRQKIRKTEGSTVKLIEQIVEDEEVYEKTRLNQEKKRKHLQGFVDRFQAKASKASQAQSKAKMVARIPSLEKLKSLHDLDFLFKECPFPGKIMIEAKALDFSYEKEKPLISNCSLSIGKKDRIAIIGKNGYGKSTLLNLLGSTLEPQKGSIRYYDNVEIGFFGQTNIERLHPNHSIEDEIASANKNLSLQEIKGLCGLMLFSGDLSKKKVSVLSGGEKSRCLLGKIIATPCNLLLLDEPTHHLDMESIEALIDALEDFSHSFVIVTHSELILKRLNLTKIIVCHKDKQELFLGSYEDFLSSKGWEEEASDTSSKKTNTKKEDRQRRAELIKQKSKVLNPIKKEIALIEKEIIDLEEKQEQDEKTLCEDKNAIALMKTVGERKKKIDTLFKKLEDLHTLLHEKEETFSL